MTETFKTRAPDTASLVRMSFDIDKAQDFMSAHGRLLDRRRFDVVIGRGGEGERALILDALNAYRNPDGGYGWGLEPDLRERGSQPGGAQHAFEAMADAAPLTSDHAVGLCDWLAGVTLPDGGLPFALPVSDPTACAPFWTEADPGRSSLQITAAVAAHAHRVARSNPHVAAHPWLATATRFCLDAIRDIDDPPFAYVLSFAIAFLDAASEAVPEARERLESLRRFVPADGAVRVIGGKQGETLHLLDLSPAPGRPARTLVRDDAVTADLDRLEQGQCPDGGWEIDFDTYSPAAALEWRGYATVRAVAILRGNGR